MVLIGNPGEAGTGPPIKTFGGDVFSDTTTTCCGAILFFECYVRFGSRSRFPLQRVVLTSITGPGVEDVDHGVEFGFKFRNRPLKHALQRRNLRLVTIGLTFLFDNAVRSVFIDPFDAEVAVKFRAKAGSKKTVAKEPA